MLVWFISCVPYHGTQTKKRAAVIWDNINKEGKEKQR